MSLENYLKATKNIIDGKVKGILENKNSYIIGYFEGVVKVLNKENLNEIQSIEVESKRIESMIIIDLYLISAGFNKIEFFNLENNYKKEKSIDINLNDKKIYSLCNLNNNLMVGGVDLVKIIDINTSKLWKSIKTEDKIMNIIQYNNLLYFASYNGKIFIYDSKDLSLVNTVNNNFINHRLIIYENCLVTVEYYNNYNIKAFDINNNYKEIEFLKYIDNIIHFTIINNYLITGTYEGNINLYDISIFKNNLLEKKFNNLI